MQEMQGRYLDQKDPLEKEMATHSNMFAWEIYGQRSLAGYSPWGCKELGTTEQLTLRLLPLSTRDTLSTVPAAHMLCEDGVVGQTEGPTVRACRALGHFSRVQPFATPWTVAL